jgi:hypothetical protein
MDSKMQAGDSRYMRRETDRQTHRQTDRQMKGVRQIGSSMDRRETQRNTDITSRSRYPGPGRGEDRIE